MRSKSELKKKRQVQARQSQFSNSKFKMSKERLDSEISGRSSKGMKKGISNINISHLPLKEKEQPKPVLEEGQIYTFREQQAKPDLLDSAEKQN